MPATTLRHLALSIAVALAMTPAVHSQTINVDVNNGSSNHYTGTGIVPGDTGTTWNNLNVQSSPVSLTIPDGSVMDSSGTALPGVTITIASSNGTSPINRYSTDSNTTPNPLLLMRDYTFSGTYNVTVTGLATGTYQFWYFGHGDAASQTGTVTVDAANGGGGGSTANSALGRDLINGGNGVSYVFLDGRTVDSSGTFNFQVANYLNGFQLRKVATTPPVTVDNRRSIFGDAGATAYTGTAVADVPGTTWNQLPESSSPSYTVSTVLDATGTTVSGASLTVTSSGSQISTYGANSPGNPNPLNLMRDYFFGSNFTLSFSGIPQGNYFLYVFAHGDQANQNSTVTVASANGGGSGTTSATGADNRDLFAPNAEGYSYLKFTPNVGASGNLSFTANSYFTGFQLVPYPAPVFAIQPPASPGAALGSNFTLSTTATGPGTLTYRWQKNGTDIFDGATGNSSTYAGTDSNTLVIQNIQNADAGDYALVAMNPGGATTSGTAALTVSATPQAPSISNDPAATSVLATSTANLSVVANGTYPLSFAWYKDGNPLSNGPTTHGSVISGTNTANLSIANSQLADAGSYHVVVGNSVDSDTSASAALTVNQAPTILNQPANATVADGQEHTLSATFGPSFPAGIYQWQITSDGLTWTNVSGGSAPSLALTASTATSGFYRVTASNSVGSVTSSTIYFGIPSTQSVTFAPGNNATGIAIDQQLRLVFSSAPKLGLTGALRIHDASNDAVVATIDRSLFVGYTLFSGTIINALKQTVQGKQMYYLPMAIYGNEVWITLGVNQRLTYAKTYYVTMDSGLLVDSSNGAFPAITSSTAWRFSTKVSGPATPTPSTGPTTVSVGMDGAGDFATIQGAADWIPQNNTLRRNIRIKPGIYRDIAYFGPGRNFVTLAGDGATRESVQLIHLYAAEVYGDGARGLGTLRIDSNDVNVCDMTIDNGAYVAQPNLAGAFAPPAPAFAGPINTVATTGQRLVFDNILMKGGQDTLYTITGIAYFYQNEIWGSVDFIYGEALAVFDQCDIVQIRSTGGPVCAPSTPYAQPYGEVFLNCRFPRALVANGYPYNVGVGTTTFMRPWRQDGMTAIINCQLDTHFSTKGWGDWGGSENPCRAREYGSTMIGGGAAPTVAQRQTAGAYWLNTHDPDYTTSAMSGTDPLLVHPTGSANRVPVTVDPADYTLETIFGHAYFNLNGWMPTLIARFTTQPSSQTVDEGDPLILSVVATGTPAPSYQWYKDGSILTGETNATFSLASVSASDAGTYTAIANNAAGSTESAQAVLTVNVTDPYTNWATGYFGTQAATDGASGVDFDHDGLLNRLEFFLGGNPKVQDAASILPTAAKPASGPNALVFTFRRNKTAAAIVWSTESSTDLAGLWNTAVHGANGVEIETITDPVNGDLDLITVTIPTTEQQFFARLRID